MLKLLRYAIAGWIPGGRKHCVVCGYNVWRFMPYRQGSRGVPPLMRALDTVGSDPDHFQCPHCGAHDRERHLYLYMQCTGLLERIRGHAVLHFAPERRLRWLVATRGPSLHVLADLFPNVPDVQPVNMLEMPFKDGSFDLLIANHVLEHVSNSTLALTELLRVLKPGGEAVLQTPYSRKLQHAWEDAGIDTPEAKLQAYGQEDHVRLFGRDIFQQITSVGFESKTEKHADLLSGFDCVKYGLNPEEPFFLFRKPT